MSEIQMSLKPNAGAVFLGALLGFMLGIASGAIFLKEVLRTTSALVNVMLYVILVAICTISGLYLADFITRPKQESSP